MFTTSWELNRIGDPDYDALGEAINRKASVTPAFADSASPSLCGVTDVVSNRIVGHSTESRTSTAPAVNVL